MRNAPIYIIDADEARLRGLLASRAADRIGRDQEHLTELAVELDRAFVVEAGDVPSGVVMLHSRVSVADLATGERRELTLVFPAEADARTGRVSVLAPLGCALMGYREGDVVEWQMPGGFRRLRIERVLDARGPRLQAALMQDVETVHRAQ